MLFSQTEWLLDYRPFIGAVVFWLGAIVGSFINVVVYRLPIMMERNWRHQCSQLLDPHAPLPAAAPELFNLALPPSHCPHCNHAIRWWENIPLLSYLFLLGKCSACSQVISVRYPLVELLTATLSTLTIWHLGSDWLGFTALLLTWSLVALALIDFDTQLLPDDITLPLIWIGIFFALFTTHTSLHDAVIGAMVGYLSLWSVYWLFKMFTGKEGMGYGDFKLLAALGAWLGWQALPMVILLSSLLGSVVGIGLVLLQKRDAQIPMPFGPFLAIAGWITLTAGDMISIHFPFFSI